MATHAVNAAALPGHVTVPVALLVLLDTAVTGVRDFLHDEIDPTASAVSALDEVRDAIAPYLLEDPTPPLPPWLVAQLAAGWSLRMAAQWYDPAYDAVVAWDLALRDTPDAVASAVIAHRTAEGAPRG